MSSEEVIGKIIRYGQFLEKALGKREDQQVDLTGLALQAYMKMLRQML